MNTMGMAFTRDPVSELFDAGARSLLSRAYAHPGTWQGTRLRNPEPRHLAWARGAGIDLLGRDPVPGGEARTRWARGFVRAVYYQHKWHSAIGGGAWRAERRAVAREAGGLVVEVGRALPGGRQAGTLLHPGRSVRVKLMPGGQAKARAVAKTPPERVWADHGPAWADPGRRDW